MPRSPICRASPSITVSMHGASTAKCRIRRSRLSTPGIRRTAEGTMSSRDAILASIRTNLPRVDRPLPAVPLFDDRPPASLLAAFKDSLHLMGGEFLDLPAAGDALAPVREK